MTDSAATVSPLTGRTAWPRHLEEPLPSVAAIGGMAVPAAIHLALNAGGPGAGGWGTAMSTDTAFALGMLALVGRRFPQSLRAFILTVAVVDDLVAFVVIVAVYSSS